MEKRRKRKKSAKERKREKGEEEEAHIKYVRDANKNPQRTRARGRYDLSRLHAHTDTSILISLSLRVSRRGNGASSCCVYEIYWCLPTTSGRRREEWFKYDYGRMKILWGFLASDYQKGREGIKRNVKFIVLKQEIPANFPYIVTFDSIKDIQPRSLYIREIVLLLNFNVLIQDHKRVVSISLSVGFARRRTAVSISRRQSNHVNQGWHY